MFLFQIIIGIAIVWSVAAILTVTNVLPPGRKDRTDYKLYALHNANWLNVPYPGKSPTLNYLTLVSHLLQLNIIIMWVRCPFYLHFVSSYTIPL